MDDGQKTVLDAYRDMKQQVGEVCQLIAVSLQSWFAAANQRQQPQPQKVSVPAPQEQQPMESVSTPQPPIQPQERPQQPQKEVSVTPQTQQQQQLSQQEVSVSPSQAQAQRQVNKVIDAPPKTKPQPEQQSETQANPSVREKGTIPSGVVNLPTPEEEAAILYRAFTGRGCDVGRLLRVLTQRDATHRQLIRQQYRKNYGEELSDRIEVTMASYTYKNANAAPAIPRPQPWPQRLGRQESQELLVACLDDKARDEGTNVDVNKAKEDATQLYKDGEQKMWGTNNKTFIDIFAKRNRPHLAAVDAAYDKLYGHSLEEAVRKETSRSFMAGLLTLLKCAKNPAKYFAEVLYNSMKRFGTSDTTLIRVVVTRAGIDMEDIKKEYDQAYKTSLKDCMHDETSGDYRTLLLNLLE